MNISYRIIKNKVQTFNRFSHNSSDFYSALRKFSCDYVEKSLRKKGYYVAAKNGDYIFIDSKLSGVEKLEVQFHELVHLLCHYPVDFLEHRQHLQAQVFSLIFLIPKKDILEYAEMDLSEIDYRLHPYLKLRWRILEKYGI